MKKVLLVLAAIVFIFSAISCKKICDCKEKNSGYSTTVDLEGVYSGCKDLQKALNDEAARLGYNQKWTCN